MFETGQLAAKMLFAMQRGEMNPIFGDQIERIVSFKSGSDVSQLAGKPIRLRFAIKDGDVYSFRFRK